MSSTLGCFARWKTGYASVSARVRKSDAELAAEWRTYAAGAVLCVGVLVGFATQVNRYPATWASFQADDHAEGDTARAEAARRIYPEYISVTGVVLLLVACLTRLLEPVRVLWLLHPLLSAVLDVREL